VGLDGHLGPLTNVDQHVLLPGAMLYRISTIKSSKSP
jgi:hypothetical protein